MDGWKAEVLARFTESESQLAKLFKDMATSKECSVVWAAIERRLDIAQQLHNEQLQRCSGGELDGFGLPHLAEKDLCGEVENLVWVVWAALEEAPFRDRATVVERRKLNDRFAKAVAILMDGLNLLSEGDVEHHGEVALRLDEHARTMAQASCELLTKSDNMGQSVFCVDIRERRMAEFASLACVGNPLLLLEAMRSGISNWASTAPLIPKPEAANAARLRLIRELTAYFWTRYGTPLRAHTLAIASVFFDCSGLDESTIAKLAP